MGQRPTLVPPPEPAAEGRPVLNVGMDFEGGFRGQLSIPADLTSGELVNLIAYLAGPIAGELQRIKIVMAGEAAKTALLVPSRRLILPD